MKYHNYTLDCVEWNSTLEEDWIHYADIRAKFLIGLLTL